MPRSSLTLPNVPTANSSGPRRSPGLTGAQPRWPICALHWSGAPARAAIRDSGCDSVPHCGGSGSGAGACVKVRHGWSGGWPWVVVPHRKYEPEPWLWPGSWPISRPTMRKRQPGSRRAWRSTPPSRIQWVWPGRSSSSATPSWIVARSRRRFRLSRRPWAGCTLYYLAVAASRMHDSARAQVLADEALDVCRQSGFRSGMAMTLGRLGTQAFQEGDYEAAEQHVREALTLRFTLDDRYGMANQLTELAQVAAARGEPERAARLDGVASALRHATGATIPQAQRANYDQFIGGLRDTLGCDRFERAWLADHGQTSEEAVAAARAIIQEALAASASAE